MINKYAGKCGVCGTRVPVRGGNLFKVGNRWAVAHITCGDTGTPQVHEYYFPTTGFSETRNSRGRCEDAPCCGCCTY